MIPRIIHHIWVGPPMPAHLLGYMATWRDLHPSWEHRLWTETNLPPLRNEQLFNLAHEYVPLDAVGQFRSDIARYEILHRHGGVYIDCDLEALQPIDRHIAGTEAFAAWEVQGRWVNNAFIGATAAHPWLADLIDELPRRARRYRGSSASRISGPKLITPLALHHDVAVLDQRLVYPYAHDELHRQGETFEEAITCHHWHHQRTLNA